MYKRKSRPPWPSPPSPERDGRRSGGTVPLPPPHRHDSWRSSGAVPLPSSSPARPLAVRWCCPPEPAIRRCRPPPPSSSACSFSGDSTPEKVMLGPPGPSTNPCPLFPCPTSRLCQRAKCGSVHARLVDPDGEQWAAGKITSIHASPSFPIATMPPAAAVVPNVTTDTFRALSPADRLATSPQGTASTARVL